MVHMSEAVDFFCFVGNERSCGFLFLLNVLATARVDVPTAPREFTVFRYCEQFHVGSSYP